ncbi:MerR family transcriptional regulator [Roseovarius ramblicola]|uniref:MerR family transcriptional regulator n=1 Tax=Roseovarius ramblicola TaxID=2022336 RepID=A0ABV5I2M8_9RHOB
MATIGEAARRSGVNIETIRYYERSGVVPCPARGTNGRRDYSEADIRRLTFIRRCRDMGFALADARRLASLTADLRANCADAQAVAETHLATVRTRLAELRAIEAELAALVQDCARRGRPCPVLEKLEEGPGKPG